MTVTEVQIQIQLMNLFLYTYQLLEFFNAQYIKSECQDYIRR